MEKLSSDRMRAGLEKAARNAPISEMCPLIKNPKWNCRPYDKGNEPFCKSIAGYTNCIKYQQWFHFIVAKAIAKEMVDRNEKKK